MSTPTKKGKTVALSMQPLPDMKQKIMSENSAPTEDTLHQTIKSEANKKRMRFWQTVVIITCFITYGLNYFTRNHIYVTTNSFRDYLDPDSEKNAQRLLGTMYTIGLFGFFASKLFFSFLIDTKLNSGVKPFAFGLIGVPIFTTLLALFTVEQYTLRIVIVNILWILTMACQAPQWSGVVKIISDWIDYKYYGRVISFMSLAYLAGDAVTRAVFAYVLSYPRMNNWRPIFYFASVMTVIAVIPLLIFVKDSPTKRGLDKPETNPDNAYAQQSKKALSQSNLKETDNYHSVKDVEDNTERVNQLTLATKGSKFSHSKSWILLKPLLPQMMFYFVILFNFSLSIIRGFFQMYTADYLENNIGTSASVAALISSVFPAMGVLSAPLNGIWMDVMINKNRTVLRYVLFPIQGIMFTVSIMILWYYERNGYQMGLEFATVLILISGFGTLGCYAMLYVLSLDLGADKSPAIVSGISDCAGLVGSMVLSFLSGYFDYQFLFAFLSITGIVFVITSVCLVLYAYCKS